MLGERPRRLLRLTPVGVGGAAVRLRGRLICVGLLVGLYRLLRRGRLIVPRLTPALIGSLLFLRPIGGPLILRYRRLLFRLRVSRMFRGLLRMFNTDLV